MKRRRSESLLIADVGGTKTVVARVGAQDDSRSLVDVRTYASRDYASFDDVLDQYLTTAETSPSQAVLAVAGPVANGRAVITNLQWPIGEQLVARTHNIGSVKLLNDVESTAWSVPSLAASDLATLQPGAPQPCGSIAVVAPGTGLGEAFLTWNGTAYTAHATEGGHTDFAPQDEEQGQLLAALREEFGHVSVERICSGDGIGNIYRHLAGRAAIGETAAVQARLAEADDITPVVVSAALAGKSPLCARTIHLFTDVLAAEAGNFALKTLATGGVVLAGGLPRHLLPFLQTREFLDRFTAKGRFSEWLGRMPLSVLRDPLAPLRGAAVYALTQIRGAQSDVTMEARR